MTWADFITELNLKYYNHMAIKAQRNEFNNLKQGNMTVIKAILKFDQLAGLCPQIVPTKEERVLRMMGMFKIELQ